jgi:hypothetical protein
MYGSKQMPVGRRTVAGGSGSMQEDDWEAVWDAEAAEEAGLFQGVFQ